MAERDKIPYETSLSSLLINVVKKAQEDGVITLDEGELINRIQIDTREVEAAIAKAMKEGGGSIKDVFKQASERMIENATNIAKRDGVITDDEAAILTQLIEELDKMDL